MKYKVISRVGESKYMLEYLATGKRYVFDLVDHVKTLFPNEWEWDKNKAKQKMVGKEVVIEEIQPYVYVAKDMRIVE